MKLFDSLRTCIPYAFRIRRYFNDPTSCKQPESVLLNPTSSLFRLCTNIESLRKVHGFLVVHGLPADLPSYTKLVSLYGSFGYVEHARLVFDSIQYPDFYSWKVLIRWYFLNDFYLEVIDFFNKMRVSVQGNDDVVFSIVLKACCELRDMVQGKKAHCLVIKAKSPDSFVLTGLVNMYAKSGEVDSARYVFDEIVDRNVVSWTSMIVAYVQNDCMEEGLILFNNMREAMVAVNQFTVGSLVTACAKLGGLHHGKWFHGYAIKNGIELNSFLVTAFLDMYVKCGDVRDARSLFDELSTVDLISWTAMIVGYTQRGYPDKALEFFVDDKWSGLIPNSITIASLLSACAQLGNLNMGFLLHAMVVKHGLDDDLTVRNALIDMYAKCHMIDYARNIFEATLDKNLISWNSIISGHAQTGSAYEAIELFLKMHSDSLSLDAVTLVSVISATAFLGAYSFGSSLHAFSLKIGLLLSSIYVGSALLSLYSKCGDAKSARQVFDAMQDKNTVTWSAIIGGYGMQGDGSECLSLFRDMLKEDFEPNEVLFTTILTACSHTGMVGEGGRLFELMCEEYNFVPSMKHYACMVDLFARAGKLEEALDFIVKMPVQPNASVLGAFLHGCALHSRFDLGEIAIRKMQELHPDDPSYYVLMSNLYASDGRWSQVKQVRDLMKQRGLNKAPGCSLIEIDINNKFSYAKVASFS